TRARQNSSSTAFPHYLHADHRKKNHSKRCPPTGRSNVVRAEGARKSGRLKALHNPQASFRGEVTTANAPVNGQNVYYYKNQRLKSVGRVYSPGLVTRPGARSDRNHKIEGDWCDEQYHGSPDRFTRTVDRRAQGAPGEGEGIQSATR